MKIEVIMTEDEKSTLLKLIGEAKEIIAEHNRLIRRTQELGQLVGWALPCNKKVKSSPTANNVAGE